MAARKIFVNLAVKDLNRSMDFFKQLAYLSTVLLVGRGDEQGKQMP